MPKISLDHFVIKSSDFAVSDDFYARVLGVEVIAVYDFFHVYRLGDQQINVHGPGIRELANDDRLARLPVEPGNSDMAFRWDGPIEEALAHLAACGVDSHTGIVEATGARGAGISVYFRDPDGSLLEFITYPEG